MYPYINIFNITNSMLEDKQSTERQFYRNTLIEKMKKTRESFSTPDIYLEQRAKAIVQSIISKEQIFGTGLTELHTKDTLNERDISSVVIVAVLDEQGQAQIQKYLHLFSHVFIINLTISSSQAQQAMKVSPIRKKLKGFLEISLNFNPFIDSIYTVNHGKSNRQANFVEGFTSYISSLPKFHQYQFNFSKTENNKSLATTLGQVLNTKLSILERHQSSQYKISSSPRLRILLIDRKIDAMSPLIYSYFYGPISKQLQLLDDHHEFTTKSALYSTLFTMDIQQASELLLKLSSDKAVNRKQTIEKNEVQQIKKAITMFCDQNTSSKQIQIIIDCLSAIKDFCKRRAIATALQQTIVNNRSEGDQKMSPSKIIDRIIEWASLPLEKYKPSEQDYVKMLILAYMVNSFWFFQRRIINAGLEGNRKGQIVTFCKKIQDSYKPLLQKKQGEERYDLYRHQPVIISEIDDWISSKREFEELVINKSSANRQNRYVIAINGVLGYNQACFILRYFKQRQQKVSVTIFCERLVTTKQYLKLLLKNNGN